MDKTEKSETEDFVQKTLRKPLNEPSAVLKNM